MNVHHPWQRFFPKTGRGSGGSYSSQGVDVRVPVDFSGMNS